MNHQMDPAAASEASFCIPDHKLIRRIGQGSYGQVWLAQNVMGAFRAVKIVCRKDFNDEVPFQRELTGIRCFEPLSRSHPGFIHVLHVGNEVERGYFYYVMELGDDVNESFLPETYAANTLDSILRSGRRLSAEEILHLGLRLSDALHHLHESGLVHRDIKPSNILFVGGLPKLADIGMVAAADAARSYVGTPGYMPPEGPGTRQADVYALGKVFYEALTGLNLKQFPELPTFFDGNSQEDRFLEINEIINRACHHDLKLRYPSARKLHAELVAIENGRSVIRLHELEQSWARAKRWMRIAAVASLVVASAAYVMIRDWNRTERERQQNVGFFTSSSMEAVQNGNFAKALRDLVQVVSVSRDEHSRKVNHLRYGAILSQIPKLTYLQSYGMRINHVEFAADQQGLFVSLADGRCQMLDAESGRVMVEYIGHTNSVPCLAVSPDGKQIATAGMDGTARLWDRWSGRQLQLFEHPVSVSSVGFHPRGGQLATGSEDGVVRFWDIRTARLLDEIKAHQKDIDCVRFSHSGDLLVTTGRDNYARLWNTSTKLPVGEPIRHAIWVSNAAFSPDDERLVTGCQDSAAYVWAVNTHSLMAPPLRHERAVRHVEYSPEGRYILTTGWDNVVRQWNALTGIQEGCALKHSSPVMCATYSPDGRRIASGCIDGTLRVWDQAGKATPRILEPNAVAVSEDGNHFASRIETNVEIHLAGSPGTLEDRVPFSGKLRGTFFNRDASRVAIITEETNRSPLTCQIWKSPTAHPISPKFLLRGRPIRMGFAHQQKALVAIYTNRADLISFDSDPVRQWPLLTNVIATNACFSGDDDSVAVMAASQVSVFERQSRRLRFGPLQHATTVLGASFSPDGKHLLSWTSDRNIQARYAQVWDSRTGAPEGVQRWHADGVQAAAWFGDSERFVTVGEDGIGKIWSLSSDTPSGSELKHDHQIDLVDMSGDSSLILTSGLDLSARLWDADSGLPVGPPLRFPSNLQSARFSNLGRQLTAYDGNGVVFVASLVAADEPESVLASLAHLLEGRLEAPINGDEVSTANAHAVVWRRLRTEYPAYFTITQTDIIAWHRMEAERNRAIKDRRGELFHLNLLLAWTPEDRYLVARRKHVLDVLATETGAH